MRRGNPARALSPERLPPGRVVRYEKAFIFRTIGYVIHTPEVLAFHNSSARLRINSAPARTSKSYSAAAEVMPDSFPDIWQCDDGRAYPIAHNEVDSVRRIWIVAPDYKLAKEFDYLYRWLIDERKRYGWQYQVIASHNTPDTGDMKIHLGFGSDYFGRPIRTLIEVRSAKNERSLQSEEIFRLILSETADHPEAIWAKYLSTRYGRAIFPTTPKITGEWVRKLIEQGKDNPDLSIESFQYDGRCNPSYDWERYWIEHAKAESRQSAQEFTRPIHAKKPPSVANEHDCFTLGMKCLASRDPHFAEQFLGQWTFAEARVLPFRWRDDGTRKSHVLDVLPAWYEHADQYVSVDYGFTDPAACGFYAVNADGTVLLFDEIYQSGLTAEDFVRQILGRAAQRSYRIKSFYGDPRKPEVMRHYQKLRLPVIHVNKQRQADRQVGFMTFQDYLSDDPDTGLPKFFVMRQCRNAIAEFRLLRRKESHIKDEWSTGSFAGEDHMVDATRYFLTARPTMRSLEQRLLEEGRDFLSDLVVESAKHNRTWTQSSNARRMSRISEGGVMGLNRG